MQNNLKILFLGDVFGRAGREAVAKWLPLYRKEKNIDFAIVNGENLAGGSGITDDTAREMFKAGVDCMTSGNHVWRKSDALQILEEDRRVLRPMNYPPGTPGRGWAIYTVKGCRIAVMNLLGRVYMEPMECPFRAADKALAELGDCPVICDIHAEATSEKVAMSWYLDGRVSAVIGTHTHVQTADERILPGGTAAITDAGMTGSHDSVIGVEKEIILKRFLTGMPGRFKPAVRDIWISGVMLEICPETGRAVHVQRIQERGAEKHGYFIKG